jgi:hypothetical protein
MTPLRRSVPLSGPLFFDMFSFFWLNMSQFPVKIGEIYVNKNP